MKHAWKITVWRSPKDGQWYCRLVRGNRRTVWHTEGYTRKHDALKTARMLAEPLGACVVEPA